MNFKYYKFPNDPTNNPFPSNTSAKRPVIRIDFDSTNGGFGYLVLLDSGADWCVFHASIGEKLGLVIKDGKEVTFKGTSGEDQKAYFHTIEFKVGGVGHKADIGFSYDIEKLPYGLLGQCGFFDKWIVKFEYHKENIELKQIS